MLLHPSDVLVYVSVTVPTVKAVTTPPLVMVAIAVLLLDQMPFVEGVTFAVAPTQTAVAPPIAGFVGTAFMVTLVVATETQLLALVTVNV